MGPGLRREDDRWFPSRETRFRFLHKLAGRDPSLRSERAGSLDLC